MPNKDKVHLEFEQMRVRRLFKQSFILQLIGLINAAVFAVVVREQTPADPLIKWGLAVIVVFVARAILQKSFNSKYGKENSFDPFFWENLYIIGVFMAGCLWGVAGSLILGQTDNVLYDSFLGFILAGTTAGAAVAYCTSFRSIVAFIIPSIFPFALRIAINGGAFRDGMAFMLLLYVFVQLRSMYFLGRDVLQRSRLQYEKDQLLTKLVGAQARVTETAKMAALGTMAGSIAHEVNNPLAIIRGINGLMAQQSENNILSREKVAQFTTTIDETIVRIAKIVSNMRSFAQEANEEPMRETKISVIMRDTLSLCRERFTANKIKLEVSDIPDFAIKCRANQISQAILNLLNNCIDATLGRPDAWAQIDARLVEGKVQISVTDNGTGILPEDRDKILLPFFTTKEVGKGTGLGLSVAHQIVNQHEGTLMLDAESGQTRFVMTFPLSLGVEA